MIEIQHRFCVQNKYVYWKNQNASSSLQILAYQDLHWRIKFKNTTLIKLSFSQKHVG